MYKYMVTQIPCTMYKYMVTQIHELRHVDARVMSYTSQKFSCVKPPKSLIYPQKSPENPQISRHTDAYVVSHIGICVMSHTDICVVSHTDIPTCIHTNIHTYKHTNVGIYTYRYV